MQTWHLVFIGGGFAALIFGAEWLVRGSSRLAVTAGISPVVVGLTVVAFGTSSPELGVSLISVFGGNGGIALGNVVGSNLCNVLLILGLAALASPLPVDPRLIRRDVPLMIAASLLLWAMAMDGKVSRWDGIVLFAGILVYIGRDLYLFRKESRFRQQAASPVLPGLGSQPNRRLHVDLLLIVAGVLVLVSGARMLVAGAVALATAMGVSEMVIGLTIVSIGTSLPEIATSLVAGYRGNSDIAVGNIVGSNLFNILAVLGLTAALAPGGVPAPPEALSFDIPLMVSVMVVCLPVFITGRSVSRWEGAMFFGGYAAYILYLLLPGMRNLL
ncbi:MAG: calcium/sodium antiporter [Desulfobacteraceae bacterium]|jgi:cation:H+ antiporter|nr:calcium/sodium antiporter [Desulfobacteraceae bacterium]